MAKALCVLACLMVVANAAPLGEKFLPHFMESDNAVASTAAVDASASAAVNASPIVVSQGSAGKKVQITITKEVTKGNHGAVGAAGVDAHAHAHVHNHQHAAVAAPAPAHLVLDNSPVVIDNETMAGVLEQLLAGNIQNVQAHGQPLAVPPGGKPVAVIFSSAMHVVDLGELQPPASAPVHEHHVHNHTEHAAINHTSLLESLMSPLMSLTHIGGHAEAAAAVPVQTTFAQPMQMQPVVVMMPVPQQFQTIAAPAGVQVDASAQLGGVLQGILSAKQQILESSLAAHNHAAHSVPVVHPAAATVDVGASAAVAAEVPVVTVPQVKKVKKVDISITKTKVV